jgi:peptidoglycan/LPS O-acetylase OafA/YrhL
LEQSVNEQFYLVARLSSLAFRLGAIPEGAATDVTLTGFWGWPDHYSRIASCRGERGFWDGILNCIGQDSTRAPSVSRPMSHVNSLDGIRGIAVALVMLFHFGALPAGWVGVQIFFVLSGYLITQILLREKEKQQFGDFLGRFYWRRSLRIFPLYFTFLALALVAYTGFGEPKSFATDWPYLATYTTNFGRLRSTDIGPIFVHLWSLAVEEQFYLFWPLLVYFLPMHIFKRALIAIIALTPLLRLGLY